MKKSILTATAALIIAPTGSAAILASYDFATGGGNLSGTPDANFTISDIAITPGSSNNTGEFLNVANDLNARFSGRGTPTEGDGFFEFTLTPLASDYTLQSITWSDESIMTLAGGTTSVNFEVFSSMDTFTTALDTQVGSTSDNDNRSVTGTVSLDISSLSAGGALSAATTFRVFVDNVGGTNGALGQRGYYIDNLAINGEVIPEPSAGLLSLLGLSLTLRRKR